MSVHALLYLRHSVHVIPRLSHILTPTSSTVIIFNLQYLTTSLLFRGSSISISNEAVSSGSLVSTRAPFSLVRFKFCFNILVFQAASDCSLSSCSTSNPVFFITKALASHKCGCQVSHFYLIRIHLAFCRFLDSLDLTLFGELRR